MQPNQASIELNMSAYPMLLVEQVTNQVFHQIYPITGLETSYFPKFMKCFWVKYPRGRILSDTELLELCFDTVDSIVEERTPNDLIAIENETNTVVDQELVLSILFQPSEIVSTSRDDLLNFPKKRDYFAVVTELITELNLSEETLEKYIEHRKLKKKHLNRLAFPSNTNYTNINNFITHLSCVCGFLFSDSSNKAMLLRTLYYIFFKKISTLNEDSILLYVDCPERTKKKGFVCLDFSMNYNTIGYLINFEEGYIFDYKDHTLVKANQIVDKKEFSQLVEGEIFLSSQIEAQVVADRIKQKTQEQHLDTLSSEKHLAEPNFILNQIEQLSLLQTNETTPSLPTPNTLTLSHLQEPTSSLVTTAKKITNRH
jgi:predicted transcriptional regulator